MLSVGLNSLMKKMVKKMCFFSILTLGSQRSARLAGKTRSSGGGGKFRASPVSFPLYNRLLLYSICFSSNFFVNLSMDL